MVNVTEQSEQPVPNNEVTSNRVPPAPKRIRGVKKTDFVTYKLEQEQKELTIKNEIQILQLT